MASYKVAQDVEAEDKLLGPFSFRQFIYLIIAAMAGIIAYGLSRLFLPLFIIPLPIVIFFVILALPLRKDQPMEIYLAAIVQFYLKPRKRLWQPDGIQSMVEITVPNTQAVQRTKNLSENEAERRLAYLATLADTQGWSIRNAAAPTESSMVSDVYNEAQSYQDVFDDTGDIARAFEDKIAKADAARRQAMMASMQQAAIAQQQAMQAAAVSVPQPQEPDATEDLPQTLSYNPYPTSMRQHVIAPSGAPSPAVAQAQQPIAPRAETHAQPSQDNNQSQTSTPAEPAKTEPASTSDNEVSPDIISLASNTDLSIDTIAREANRIKEKKSRHDPEEVVISLR